MTYAGNPYSLDDINRKAVDSILSKYQIDTVIHLAAESHVDRSITGHEEFITTNINGTFTLLEAVRNYWSDFDCNLFHHVSTDEVYGS